MKKIYYVESPGYWFVVAASSKREAQKEAVSEFGRGVKRNVRMATSGEIKYYTDLKGTISV